MEISNRTIKFVEEIEKECINEFKKIEEIQFKNSFKVLAAFQKFHVSESHFNGTTGYGYNDIGRETIERVFAYVLGSEDALVRNNFVSGSHALSVCLFALLRPNDTLLSISGTPYDTLHEVIGIKKNDSSLISYGIKYEEIDLINDDFDYNKITNYLKNNKVKLIEIQRSKGYSTRKSLSIEKIANIIQLIRSIDKNVIIMVDNCYCEMVEERTPIEVGADVIVGSLIKNLGGGIAPNGAYIAGSKKIIDLCGERLTLPGEGREVGPTLEINKLFLQGLYFSPSVVCSSLKTAILTSRVMEKLGFLVDPKYDDKRVDIVQNIIFNDEKKLIKYCEIIQSSSAIDSNVTTIPVNMPGYEDKVIMASGSFTQGSSIELSCDGPLRSPYIAYQQGSLTYDYGKLAIMNVVERFKNER